MEGKKGSLANPGCIGGSVIAHNMRMPVYDPILISYCILKPKSPKGFITVHTWLHLPHTHPLLLYLFSSSSWFNSSIFSFCIPSTKARARWRFPSASVTYWSKKRARDTKVSHVWSSTKLLKKGSELGNKTFRWSVSEDAVVRAHFPESLRCRDQDNKNCSVSSSCKCTMLQCLSDLTLLENPALIRVKNLKPEKFWKSGHRLPVQFSPSHEARETFQTSVN